MIDLDAIRERHREVTIYGKPYCASREKWPCDAAQALARVDELEARLLARPESKP